MLLLETLAAMAALGAGGCWIGTLPDPNRTGDWPSWRHAAAAALYLGGIAGIVHAAGFHRLVGSFRLLLG